LIHPAELANFPYVREFFAFALLFGIAMWAISVGTIERDLQVWMAARPRRGPPFKLILRSLAVSGFTLVTNMVPFALWSKS
jgi:hypothetical protein